jgi:thiamine-phosphate pyrophosphorylase
MNAAAPDRALDRLRGLYLLTPDWSDTARLLAVTEAALAAGVRALQYRHKQADTALRRAQAAALRALTRRHGALLIVNDRVELAAEVDADGLHIGRDDGDVAALRTRWPRLLGVSCYAEPARARAAAAAGADYVAFGAVFASPTKPAAVRAPLPLLTDARRDGLYVVAIGGIDAGNIAQVAAAGAHAAALISAVYDAADPAAAVRLLAQRFKDGEPANE